MAGKHERMEEDVESDTFPEEIKSRLSDFDESLSKVEDIFQLLHSVPLIAVEEKLSAIDKAKLHLVGAYAINSLFWTYLNTKGENPKEHGVKEELDRIKSYMGRVKEIEDKQKAPKLDTAASKKFVRNALWRAAHKRSGSTTEAPAKQLRKDKT